MTIGRMTREEEALGHTRERRRTAHTATYRQEPVITGLQMRQSHVHLYYTHNNSAYYQCLIDTNQSHTHANFYLKWEEKEVSGSFDYQADDVLPSPVLFFGSSEG